MALSREFLRLILPANGNLCGEIFEPGRKQPRRVWAASPDALAVALEGADDRGATVYHALSSFRERTSRRADNVLGIKSFWLDVDAGEGKPYRDGDEIRSELQRFLAAAGLPDPVLVGSGMGIHAYWPLDRELSLTEWKPLAEGLKRLCAANNFFPGPERTADAASILRPVGSHHRKDPNNVKPVVGGAARGPYSLADLAALGHLEPARRTDLFAGSMGLSRTVPSGLTADLLNTSGPPTADAELIADQCEQLGAVRRSLGAGLSEPVWYAALGVIAFTRDGDDIAHEWSYGDERYDEAEVDRKLTQVKRLTGPTTCERFASLEPSRCASCPVRGTVTSPIMLGHGKRPEAIVAQAQPAAQGIELPPLTEPFRYGRDGSIVLVTENRVGQPVEVKITQYPVAITAIGRTEGDGARHVAVFKHWLPHDGWATKEIPLETLMGNQGISKLAGLGIIVHEGDLWRKYVRQSLDVTAARQKAMTIYEQFGWKDDDTAYLLGNRLYRQGQYTEVTGSVEINLRAQALSPGGAKGKGNLLAWKAAAERLGAPGSEAQLFGLMAAPAAPLMKFFGDGEGGAIISLVSHSGGKGKSTALYAASSFWGDMDGLAMVAIDTRVAKGITLGLAGNNLVIFDELRDRDPESVRDFVQEYTQGRGKLRGTADGTLIHTASRWSNLLLTASNKSLVDTIKATKGSEAMTNRVLEFVMQPFDEARKDITLDRQFLDNPGWAGEMYLQGLTMQRPEQLRKTLDDAAAWLTKTHNLQARHRFWVKALAAVWVAGRLVNALGLVSFSPERLVEWGVKALLESEKAPQPKADDMNIMSLSAEERRLRRELAEKQRQINTALYNDAENAALDILGDFIGEHMDCLLTVQDQWRPGTPKVVPIRMPQRKLLMRKELATEKLYIHQRALAEYVLSRDMSYTEFLTSLNGVLFRQALFNLGAGTEAPNIPQRCVVVDLTHPKMRATDVAGPELVQMNPKRMGVVK